jgi:large subunit ribosomal protein L25
MNVEKRTEKAALLRKKGIVPGVLYGKGFDSVSVQIPLLDFQKALREFGTSKTFKISLGKDNHIVYIKEFEVNVMDYNQITHYDLIKVSATDTLQSSVSLHFVGKEKFNASSLVFTSYLDEIEVEYAVGSGISHIDIDVAGLTEEEPFHVKDIVLPDGITLLSDPEEIVCGLQQPSGIVETVEDDVQEGFAASEEEE